MIKIIPLAMILKLLRSLAGDATSVLQAIYSGSFQTKQLGSIIDFKGDGHLWLRQPLQKLTKTRQ